MPSGIGLMIELTVLAVGWYSTLYDEDTLKARLGREGLGLAKRLHLKSKLLYNRVIKKGASNMAETTVTSLRFKKDQYDQLKHLADFEGVSVTTYMRRAVLERMEDEADYKDAQANRAESKGATMSRIEIMKQLGMKP